MSQLEQLVIPIRRQLEAKMNDPDKIQKILIEKRGEKLRNLIDNYLLLLEAKDQGITLTDGERESVLRTAKSKFESEEAFNHQLARMNQTEDELVRFLSQIEIGKKLVNQKAKELYDDMTEEKLKAFYKKHIHLFTGISRSELNRVDIRASEERSLEEAEKLAQKLYEEVRAKMGKCNSFDERRDVIQEYAYEYSDSAEAKYNSGYIVVYHNNSAKETYSPELLETALKTPKGHLSPLIRTKYGFGFFLVKEKYESKVQPYDHPGIQKLVPNMYLKYNMDQWKNQLKQKFNFELFMDKLEGMVPDPLDQDSMFASSHPMAVHSPS